MRDYANWAKPVREEIWTQAQHVADEVGIVDPNAPLKALHRMSRCVKQKGRSYHRFNLFLKSNYDLCLTLVQGEWTVSGFQAQDLRCRLSWLTPSRCFYLLNRLRTEELIKKVRHR